MKRTFRKIGNQFLNTVQRVGNALPHPATIFALLALLVVVISGIGQLKDLKLGYFREKGHYAPEAFHETHELLSLSGNVIKQDGGYLFHIVNGENLDDPCGLI